MTGEGVTRKEQTLPKQHRETMARNESLEYSRIGYPVDISMFIMLFFEGASSGERDDHLDLKQQKMNRMLGNST